MGLEYPKSFKLRSSESSSGFTAARNIPAPESVLRYVRRSSSAMVGGFGWSPSPDRELRFSLLCHMQPPSTNKVQLLLIEDNPADANLVEEALAEAQLDYSLQLLDDGAAAIAFISRLDADP